MEDFLLYQGNDLDLQTADEYGFPPHGTANSGPATTVPITIMITIVLTKTLSPDGNE